jgi:hypothetical protein
MYGRMVMLTMSQKRIESDLFRLVAGQHLSRDESYIQLNC